MTLNLGLEVINFQTSGVSPLAMELMSIFQEVIDYRESIETMTVRVKEVLKYVEKKMVPKMTACILKHTGITTTRVRLSKTLDFGYACLMEIADDKTGYVAHDIIQRYSGLDTDSMVEDYMRHKKLRPRTAKEMEEIANNFDKNTGKFIGLNTGKIRCSMTLYFDPYGSFLIKEVGHERCEYFTAAEIAGVMLHEIGHMVSTLAYSANACFQMELYKACITEFNKHASNEEKAEFVKASIKMTELDKSKIDTFNKQIDRIPTNDTGGSTAIDIFGNILTILAISVCGSNLVFMAILNKLIVSLTCDIPQLMVPLREGIVKSSDFDRLTKQGKYCEQIADEYVTKHGLAHGQISALQKIFMYSSVQFLGTSLLSNRAGTIIYHINMLPMYLYIVAFGDVTDGGGLYDGVTERCKRLAAETSKVFKNSDMSPDMVAFFIQSYEESLRLVRNKTTFQKFVDTSQLIHSTIDYVVQTPIALMLTGRYFREYQALHRRAELLMSNSLFYRAAKLEQLIKRV